MMALEDSEWQKADGFFEEVLNLNAECAEAYLGKLMAELQVTTPSGLANCPKPFNGLKNYQKAVRFGDKGLADKLEEYRLDRIYNNACLQMMESDNPEALRSAICAFESIGNWKDSQEKINKCRELISEISSSNQRTYEEAIELLNKGDKIGAVTKFRKLDGYSDSTKMLQSILNECAGLISINGFVMVGVDSDGFVLLDAGRKKYDLSAWENIVEVSEGQSHTVGLKADGTVVAEGNNTYGQCEVSDWSDIVKISAGTNYTIGLKSDGTLEAAGKDDCGQCEVFDWTDVVDISARYDHTVGIKKDGTLVATGKNDHGECNVSAWKDIVAISTGLMGTVGLKSDGTINSTIRGTGFEMSEWENIVAVSACQSKMVGLKADGTVLDTRNSQFDTSVWKNIVAISASDFFTLGLRDDGSVVVACHNDTFGKADLSRWQLGDVFKSREQRVHEFFAIEQERLAAERQARKDELLSEQNALQAELPTLKGLFAGKRRKEIERRLEEIEKELQGLE
jgi:hypothetical protein